MGKPSNASPKRNMRHRYRKVVHISDRFKEDARETFNCCTGGEFGSIKLSSEKDNVSLSFSIIGRLIEVSCPFIL